MHPMRPGMSLEDSAAVCAVAYVALGETRPRVGIHTAGLTVEMDGTIVCRQKGVRLQHHRVDHQHRRRPGAARLLRARAPLGDWIGGHLRWPPTP